MKPMQTSAAGRRLIESFEGLRASAYRDATGIWTIGYGHTAAAGPPVPCAEMTITGAQADSILNRDLSATEQQVVAALRRQPTQNQFDAMVSLAFNIGVGAFRRSTVLRKFNAGDVAGAAQSFLLWDRAGGRVLADLVRRRREEAAEFLNTGAAALPSAPPEEVAHLLDVSHEDAAHQAAASAKTHMGAAVGVIAAPPAIAAVASKTHVVAVPIWGWVLAAGVAILAALVLVNRALGWSSQASAARSSASVALAKMPVAALTTSAGTAPAPKA